MLFQSDEAHRASRASPLGAFAVVVLLDAALWVIADAYVIRAASALEHVTVIQMFAWEPPKRQARARDKFSLC